MEKTNEPAGIKYTNKIIELVESEICEINKSIENTEDKLAQLEGRKRLLHTERKNLYRELRKFESESCTYPDPPNIPLIMKQLEEL